MSTSVLEPFQAAVGDVFRFMFGLEATPQPGHELTRGGDHEWELSGFLGLAGQAHGVMALRFPRSLADALLALSGVESSGEQERLATVAGLVGELTNIVAGGAVCSFPSVDIEISPPIVVKGANHQITWPGVAPVYATRFSTPKGDFELGVCLQLP